MNAIRRMTIGAFAGTLILGASACGDDSGTNPPPDGPVTVSLATPSADDGALLITITGPAITGVQPASASYAVFWRSVNDHETRVIVVGDIVNGPLFSATAPEAAVASEFAAGVMEIANRTDALRPSIAGYSLSVAR